MQQGNMGTQGSTGMGGQGQTGTSDVTYNLISVIYHALQGAETYGKYLQDAQQSGNQEIVQFLQQAQQQSQQLATRGRELLGRALQQGQGTSRMSQ